MHAADADAGRQQNTVCVTLRGLADINGSVG